VKERKTEKCYKNIETNVAEEKSSKNKEEKICKQGRK
jgi:hypothetical protein